MRTCLNIRHVRIEYDDVTATGLCPLCEALGEIDVLRCREAALLRQASQLREERDEALSIVDELRDQLAKVKKP